MYEVVHFFTDLQDKDHAYHVGDEYPRHGLSATDARIKELSGKNNKQGVVLIKLVEEAETVKEADESEKEETVAEEKKAYTKTDINRLSKDELVKLANENGIKNAENMNGTDLKSLLIDKLV